MKDDSSEVEVIYAMIRPIYSKAKWLKQINIVLIFCFNKNPNLWVLSGKRCPMWVLTPLLLDNLFIYFPKANFSSQTSKRRNFTHVRVETGQNYEAGSLRFWNKDQRPPDRGLISGHRGSNSHQDSGDIWSDTWQGTGPGINTDSDPHDPPTGSVLLM